MDSLLAEPTITLLLPAAAALAIALGFLGLLQLRRGSLNFLEIGPVYVGTVTLYTVFPLLVLWWNYYAPATAHDQRLLRHPPAAADLALIGWFFVVHLGAFAGAYVLASGNRPVDIAHFRNLDRAVLPLALGLYLTITAFLFGVDHVYELRAYNYHESYLLTDRLPTLLGQVYRVLRDSRYVVEIVVLVALATRWRQTYPWIACWLIGIILYTFLSGGARGSMVLLLGAAGVTYQHVVRPLRVREVALAALVFLFLFALSGFLRSEADRPEGTAFTPLNHHTEFEALFANAYDVYHLEQTGQVPDLPLSWHASDLVAMVPPQMLPFEKTNKARWYVETYYPEYAAGGGGLAFGVVAESILGWGWLDLVGRGLALGGILGLAHRYWTGHQDSFWAFVFYVWLTTFCYWPFRWTAFILLPLFLYRFLPIYCVLRLVPAASRRLALGPPRTGAGMPPPWLPPSGSKPPLGRAPWER